MSEQPSAKPETPVKSTAATPITRRKFISTLALGWITFTGATGIFLSSVTRYMFPNVLYEPPSSFDAGLPGEYTVDTVDERWKEKYGVWIVRGEKQLFALSTVCTHLGCTPNWMATEEMFKCPCHGSGFKKSGINFEGPAPRPLERYRVALNDEGRIIVDKNQKFQYEKGQWKDPDSFLALG
jgi:cytochrome b6-f complex iron-sulfur subunit